MMNDKGYTAITYFILRASFVGIASVSLINNVKQDAWISVILGIIIGFIPVLCIYLLANYNNEDNIIITIDKLFPKAKIIIKTILFVLIFLYTSLNFWNLINLIYSQFLNRTPIIIISITLIIPIIFLLKSNNKIISRVSFILFIFSLILIIISLLGLFNKFELNNIKPFIEYNPTKGIIPYISYNVLPIYLLLIFPGKMIKKSIIKGYIISSITLLITIILLIGILGVNLVILYQYPEFHTLKLAYENIVNFRLENILSIQWIFDIFIFTTIGLKYCNESFNIKKIYIIPILLVMINPILFKNNTIANILITNLFPYIILTVFIIILLLVFFKIKKCNKNTLKT